VVGSITPTIRRGPLPAPSSPKREDYPAYVENAAKPRVDFTPIKVLQDTKDFTISSLIAAAYDSYLTWFETPSHAW